VRFIIPEVLEIAIIVDWRKLLLRRMWYHLLIVRNRISLLKTLRPTKLLRHKISMDNVSTTNKNKNGLEGQLCLIPQRIGHLGDAHEFKIIQLSISFYNI